MSERVLHERYVLRNRAEKMEKDIEEIKERMDALLVMSNKMDNLLAMIAPVHAHAAWVDTLRKRLSTIGLVKDRRISNGEGNDAV